MADISKIKIGDDEYSIKDEKRHEHENKDTLDRFGNLIQSDHPFPTGDDTPTYNGTGLWTTEHGQVIADVSKDKETGDLTFELRRLPLFDDETDTVYIKQHFKTSELENDKKFITADDLPEITETITEPLTVTDTNTTYSITDNLFYLNENSSGQIPFAFFSNSEINITFTSSSGYMIFAKCTNGYVLMNGGQKFYYMPNNATASSQAKAISELHIGLNMTQPIKLTVLDNSITIVGKDINYNFTNESIATHLTNAGITDTFEKFVLGFARDKNADVLLGTIATMGYSIDKTITVTTQIGTRKKPLEGKKVSIIGDSISTFNGYIPSGYATHYPRETITNVSQTWWHLLCAETGAELLVNASWSGSYVAGDSTSSTNALAACSDKRIADLANDTDTPDIVICYIGINDFGQNVHRQLGDYVGQSTIPNEGTITTFSDGYALMIKKIMSAYPNAKVYCCSLLETKTANWDTDENGTFPCINNNGVALASFNERIKTLCSALGAEFIDLHACGIDYWNLDSYTHDGLHPNANGAKLIKEKIKSKLLIDYQ